MGTSVREQYFDKNKVRLIKKLGTSVHKILEQFKSPYYNNNVILLSSTNFEILPYLGTNNN